MKTIVVLHFIILICTQKVYASDTTAHGAFGKQFFVCFPKNDDTNTVAKGKYASLHLYITAKDSVQAIGTVSFYNGKQYIFPFSTQKNKTVDIEIPKEMETISYAESEQKGIYIESNEDIVVYGLSKDVYTSDAFLAYPVTALDTQYIVCSYKNLVYSIGSGDNRFSGFVAVGTEDSTIISILSPVPLNSPKTTQPFEKAEFILNKGETRMVITSRLKSNLDITGTIVTSNKKTAIFSFHERIAIPKYGFGTRDCLIEQTPPLAFLGNKYLLVPNNSWRKGLPTLIRIVAYFDSTAVFMPTGIKQLQRGQFFDIDSVIPMEITSNKPILCAQYEESAGLSVDSSDAYGDPFMAFLPPVQQFQQQYTFISAPFPSFVFHWVTVLIPTRYTSSVIIDSTPINDTIFRTIPNSDFSFGYISLSAGSHHISADTTFGIMVYGYGLADSYGYCGGQDTKRLLELIMDTTPPQMSFTSQCDSIRIVLHEDSLYDSGIEYLGIIESPNVRVTIPTFDKGSTTAAIHGVLIDPNKDGSIYFTTNDRKGLNTSATITVKGFTLQTNTSDFLHKEIRNSLTPHIITVTNTGLFSQSITPSLQSNISVSIPPSFGSFVLNPNDSLAIPLWIEAKSMPSIIDTLIFTDDCSRHKKIPLEIQVVTDSSLFFTRCNIPVQIKNSTFTVSFHDSLLEITSETDWKTTIYSVLGIAIESFQGRKNEQISVENLLSGMYILEFSSNGNLYHYPFATFK
jgi:hypothetical protein